MTFLVSNKSKSIKIFKLVVRICVMFWLVLLVISALLGSSFEEGKDNTAVLEQCDGTRIPITIALVLDTKLK